MPGNRTATARTIALRWTELDLTSGTRRGLGRGSWSGEAIEAGNGFARRIAGQGAALLVFGPPHTGGDVRAPV